MQKPIERLTREEMEEKYPDTWLGLTNIKWLEDGANFESAVVVYTDKDKDELIGIQMKNSDFIAWYTGTDDDGFMTTMF